MVHLSLSAAVNTIDQSIFRECQSNCGRGGSVVGWFQSFLSAGSQVVLLLGYMRSLGGMGMGCAVINMQMTPGSIPLFQETSRGQWKS